jgi:CDP-4-dehydro-6-deoxyglucose reductase, E1
MDSARMKELISELAQEIPRYAHGRKKFIPGTSQVLYSGPYWDNKELEMAMKALLTGTWLTAGEYVARFQNLFAKHFGVKYAHMVNSGSSANLVMIAALKKQNGWKDGDEVVVSPVGFPTTISPLVQNGLVPRFVDIEMDTLNFDLEEVHRAACSDECVGIFVSPALGNPPDMDALKRWSNCLIGDNCDSLGSKWNERLLNEYYKAWSTSFYSAHHITTGEGGMVCSNDSEFIKTARSISWWGRDCYCVGQANLLACGTCGKRFDNWLGDGNVIDHKYLFTNIGYNLKPLDLQGAIGIAQMGKITDIEAKRRYNFEEIASYLGRVKGVHVASKHEKANPCWFGVPVVCDTREIKNSLVKHLEANLIQTRSYFAGNILAHPGYAHLGDASKFPNANAVLGRVFFLGCAPFYTKEILEYISEVLDRWR